MKKTGEKPYLFFWGLIPILLLVGVLNLKEVIDINLHDIYFVTSILNLSIFLSFFLGILGFGYWSVLKLKKRLFKTLSFLHIGITFLGILVLLTTFMIPNNIITSTNTLLDSLTTINILLTLGVLLILFGQVFYPFNILFSLFKKKINFMKKIIIVFLFFLSIRMNADAGYLYRLLVDVKIEKEEIKGYMFYYSYDEYKPQEMSLISFLNRKGSHRTIKVYPEIKQIRDIDFAVRKSGRDVKVEEMKSIKVSEVLSFVPDYRLILLDKDEYSLIKEKDYELEDIDLGALNFEENCSDILISKKGNKNLKKEQEKLSFQMKSKLKELGSLEGEKGELYYSFLSEKKKYLLKKEIVLFAFCGAL